MGNNLLLHALLAFAFSPALCANYEDYFVGEVKTDTSLHNFLSITRDENQPVYCKASWAFATTSAMAA